MLGLAKCPTPFWEDSTIPSERGEIPQACMPACTPRVPRSAHPWWPERGEISRPAHGSADKARPRLSPSRIVTPLASFGSHAAERPPAGDICRRQCTLVPEVCAVVSCRSCLPVTTGRCVPWEPRGDVVVTQQGRGLPPWPALSGHRWALDPVAVGLWSTWLRCCGGLLAQPFAGHVLTCFRPPVDGFLR